MPVNPFTSQTISGYNSSPPSNDGAKTSANQISWAKHKTKLADPLKTLAEDINTAVLAAFAKTVNTDSSEINAISGSLAFPSASITATGGTITPVRTSHVVTMANAATTIQTIIPTSVTEGTLLYLLSATDKAITILHNSSTATAGNINTRSEGDETLDAVHPAIFVNNGGTWSEITAPASELTLAHIFNQVTATGSSTATTIGFDDTSPLATEGLRFFATTYSPRLAGSQIEISMSAIVSTFASASEHLIGAMFIGTSTATAGTSAVAASAQMLNGGGGDLMLQYIATSTATTVLNIECNYGANINKIFFGGNNSTALFGTSRNAWILIKERRQ